MANAGAATVLITPVFKGFQRTIGRQLGTAAGAPAERAGRSLGSSILRGVAKVAAIGGGIAAALGIRNLGRAAAQAATGLQDTTAILTGLLGSADAATDTMTRLREVARTSPIPYQTYLDAAESLAYMGIQGEDAEDILRNVGAAITAAGGDEAAMDRATGAMLQMVNSGRVYAAQLNQISDAGIPVFSGLAEHFGTNIEHVREMVSAGQVSIEDVMAVIQNAEGDTFQAMLAASDEASQTFSNQWKIAKDNIVQALAEGIFPAVEGLTPLMQRFAESGPAAVERAVSSMSNLFGRIRSMVQDVASSVTFQGVRAETLERVSSIWASLSATFRGVWPSIQSIAASLGEASAAIGISLWSVLLAVLDSLSGILERTLVPALDWLARLLRDNQAIAVVLVAAFTAWRAILLGLAIIRGVTAAVIALNVAMRANPIGLVITAIALLVAGFIWLWNNVEGFRNFWIAAWEIIKNAAVAVKDAVVAAWNWISDNVIDRLIAAFRWVGERTVALKDGMVAAWQAVRDGLGAAWRWIKENVIDRLVDAFRWVGERTIALKDGVVSAWNTLRDGLGAAWRWVKENVIDRAVSAFQWLWDRVVDVKDGVLTAWRAVRDGLKTVWDWIKENVIDRVVSAFQSVWDFIIDMKDGVVSAFETVAETIENVFRNITDGIKSALNWVFGKINEWMIGPLNVILEPFGLEIDELEKLHSGGLVPGRGEKPYMLLGGEAVLNPMATKAIGKEGVEHLNRTGELLPMGGLLPDWVTWDRAKQILWKGAEVATGQNVGEGTLMALEAAVKKGLDQLKKLTWGPEIPREYSIGQTGRMTEGVFKWARGVEEGIDEELGKVLHGSLSGDVGRDGGQGPPSSMGKVLPAGSYRIGRGAAAHGYNARDLPAPTGTPIYAAAAGTVTRAQRLARSYGIHAAINHGNWSSLYAHMSQMYVRLGQAVTRGFMIGRVGSTGNSTGPHLHLEPDMPRLYDKGGYLAPGRGGHLNRTGRPEPVLTEQQWSDISSLAARAIEAPVASGPNVTVVAPFEQIVNEVVFALQSRRSTRREPARR